MNKYLHIDQWLNRLRHWHCLVAFALLILPIFFSGFHSDDFFQLLLLRGDSVIERHGDGSLFGLFSFIDTVPAHRQQLQLYGVLPWFASDDFYFRFWRPLSELTHFIDFVIMPGQAWFAHLHSMVWFLILSYCVYQLAYVLTHYNKHIASLAWLIFLLDGQHVANIAWIANRNALIAAVFSVVSLLFYIHWVNTHKKRFYIVSVLMFALALLSAEMALGIVAYLFFYALIVQRASFAVIAKQASAYVVVLVLWFGVYRYYHYGVNTAVGLYINPITETLNFVFMLIQRIPIYISSSILPIPAGFFWVSDSMILGMKWLVLLLASIVTMFLSYAIFRFKSSNHRLTFLVISAIFCLIPVCTTLTQDRLALLQTVGMDIALAWVTILWLAYTKSRYLTWLAQALIVIHLVLSPIHLLLGSVYLAWAAKNIEANAMLIDNALHNKVMVVIRAPIGEAVSLIGIRAVHFAENPQQLFWIANNESEVQVKQESTRSLLITKPMGFASGLESTFRSIAAQPFYVGQNISIGDITVEIVRLNQHSYPVQVRLTFEQNMDSGRYVFYSYQHNQFVPVDLAQLSATYP